MTAVLRQNEEFDVFFQELQKWFDFTPGESGFPCVCVILWLLFFDNMKNLICFFPRTQKLFDFLIVLESNCLKMAAMRVLHVIQGPINVWCAWDSVLCIPDIFSGKLTTWANCRESLFVILILVSHVKTRPYSTSSSWPSNEHLNPRSANAILIVVL